MRIIRLSTTSECGFDGTGGMREHGPFPVQHMNALVRLGGACFRLCVFDQSWLAAPNRTRANVGGLTRPSRCLQNSRSFLLLNQLWSSRELVNTSRGRQGAPTALSLKEIKPLHVSKRF